MMTCDFLTYDMGAGVTAFTSTRASGVTKGVYEPIADALGLGMDRVIVPHQTHNDIVRIIDDSFMSLSPSERVDSLEGVDAEITNLKKVCICISTADCVPVLLYDPQHRAVAAIHAGWKGTVRGIVMKTISEMRDAYGSSPSDIRAVIGPSISLNNFEVGDEVYERFRLLHDETGIINSLCTWYNEQTQKWHINLWESNRQQLLLKGVLSENIHIANICTYDNTDRFYSARHDGLAAGRMVSGICLSQRS